MSRSPTFKPYLSLLAIGLLFACGGTLETTGHYRDPKLKPALKKVLVVGISPRSLYRRMYEDEFTRGFLAKGIEAVPSYQFGDSEPPTREQVVKLIAEQHFDSVLVTHLVDVKQQREYKEGVTYATPVVTGYGYGYYHNPYYGPVGAVGFDGYYSYVYNYTQSPGYYETEKTYNLETTLHSVEGGGKLVWALMSSAVDPSGADKLIKQLAEQVFAALVKDGLLPG
ncbi:MAG TPA: hypothetical protein VJR89_09915 [Polyangiales bacterium]|nr:hypothetical protein [Polyangiales bacterium]